MELQPLVVSPKAWMWKPWRPGARPAIFPLTSVCPSTDVQGDQIVPPLLARGTQFRGCREQRVLGDKYIPVEGSWTKWMAPATELLTPPPLMRATPLRLPGFPAILSCPSAASALAVCVWLGFSFLACSLALFRRVARRPELTM